MPTVAKPRAKENGFTLLEVIVALVIAGLGIVALFQAIGDGLLTVETATGQTTAVRCAQARLEELGVTLPLKPGEQRGMESDGCRWLIRVTPSGTQARQGATQAPQDATQVPQDTRGAAGLTLFAVEVQVTWSAGTRTRTVRLDSYRLGAIPAGAQTP